ncbi:uncharacterized protein [Hetaerina americana]|uniref:uncharacterized protein n=1 Tax=Hetaerina americana TaxID=62018 RepID=UPI003A7F3A03
MNRWNALLPASALLFAAAVLASNPTEHHPRRPGMYTSRYDHINLDGILKSDRLLKNYFDCLMDKGPCTADGSELKRNIPDALQTGCSKCTEKQRDGAQVVIKHLMEHKPDLWKQLEAKWDPEGEYIKRLQEQKAKDTKYIHTVKMILGHFLTVLAVVYSSPPPAISAPAGEREGKSPAYTTRFDYVNVDRFLSNTRLLNSYLACIMDKGPCTKEGNELKVILPDAIRTDCSKCTERQKAGIEKVTNFLKQNKMEQWKELSEKLDPEGSQREKNKQQR